MTPMPGAEFWRSKRPVLPDIGGVGETAFDEEGGIDVDIVETAEAGYEVGGGGA